ncbi:hypothetical protein BAG01nite_36360 [Brevibacillus agri]|uniref:Saccharopine dehydrogenase NADP binding domain-containing protein n=2 Tax=Brevibacillus TaxID=55080 RepID=A0ABQ0SUD6_9BACL|nr:hypothetical protein [Brevibacillus agri]GED27534.1 hypothetical protein BAG01nite_36360 [Brevibacillus agri]
MKHGGTFFTAKGRELMDKDKIVVVGGYGYVGATICKELGNLYPGRVYAAGRSLEKAEAFCRETAGKVRPLRFDLRQL